MPNFSIIIPTWNEAQGIRHTLQNLQSLRQQAQIIVVDGGSEDGTPDIAFPLSDRVLTAARGRANQMNTGAKAATGNILIFLHADTRLPTDALSKIEQAIDDGYRWGRFDVELAGRHPFLPVIASSMNLRSRLSGIATGDQAIFVERKLFDQIGGYPQQPLMEDIELSKRLSRHGRPACLVSQVTTSARRWETYGMVRTILLMWWLRSLYCVGTPPDRLNSLYRRGVFW